MDFQTAFDLPADDLSDYGRGMLDDIRRHGWRTTHVTGAPGFSYSTGFWHSLRKPEVLIFDFPAQLAHDALGTIYRKSKEGTEFPEGAPAPGILSGEPVWLEPMSDAAITQYMKSVGWFYRGTLPPCLHLIWPDRAGLFPWDAGFAVRMAGLQPDLGQGGLPRP